MSLIIDRNVRCTAGQRACQQSLYETRTCRAARTVNSRTHSLLHLSRSLGPHSSLSSGLRVFGSLFVVDFFFLMHMIDRPLPTPNSDSVCIECGRILRISYLRATVDLFLCLSLALSLSLVLPRSVSVSIPRCLICSLNPAPY